MGDSHSEPGDRSPGKPRFDRITYNHGGYVAHIAIKITANDAFDALVAASKIAQDIDGRVSSMYDDTRSRASCGACVRGGVVIDIGTIEGIFGT